MNHTQNAIMLVAKLNQMNVRSLSDSEIQRAFRDCVMPNACADATRRLTEARYIFFDDVQNKCRIVAE